MKTPKRYSLSHAFTLIELLIVIVIIAILASLAVPVTNLVMLKARIMQTRATIKDLQVAAKSFQTEYNRYPVDPSMTGGSGADDVAPILTDENHQIISLLLAEGLQKKDPSDPLRLQNPRAIRFIDLPMAKNFRAGIVNNGTANYALYDIWGKPFYILLDTNYDNSLDNPDLQNQDTTIAGKAPKTLPVGVAVYSTGPDRIQFTKDDITSWRQ
tara:strand:- start:722 stop:1360 length:639 start_codon:yes stop_codon:yes gene_type:complete